MDLGCRKHSCVFVQCRQDQRPKIKRTWVQWSFRAQGGTEQNNPGTQMWITAVPGPPLCCFTEHKTALVKVKVVIFQSAKQQHSTASEINGWLPPAVQIPNHSPDKEWWHLQTQISFMLARKAHCNPRQWPWPKWQRNIVGKPTIAFWTWCHL